MNEPALKHVATDAPNTPAAEPLASAARPRPENPYALEIRRRRLRIAAACGGALTLVALLAAWHVHSADAHYDRGRRALEERRFSVAIQELNAARFLLFTYRDADELAAQAAAALNASLESESLQQVRLEEAVARDVELAGSSLAEGEAAAAARALADARKRVPEGPLSADPLTLASLQALSRKLSAAGRAALGAGRWGVAGSCAEGLLSIAPGDEKALRLAGKAALGARLAARLDTAREAADRGQWRRALSIATNVLARWKDFPGARSLVGRAEAALAPKPPPQEPVVVPTATPRPTAAPPAPPPP